MPCKVIMRHFCISRILKLRTRLRDQQPPYPIHLDAKSLQPHISRGRARDDPNSQGQFFCSVVCSRVWLISIFSNYVAFRCWLHPVVSAWQRLVDPTVRREDQTWWNRWVRLPVYSLAKLSNTRTAPGWLTTTANLTLITTSSIGRLIGHLTALSASWSNS